MPRGVRNADAFTKPGRVSRSNRCTRTFLLVELATFYAAEREKCSKQSAQYCIIGTMDAGPTAPESASAYPVAAPILDGTGGSIPTSALPAAIDSFLAFCRVEKGLATNSLLAYSRDLR